jgi:hypothetical protein
MRKMMGISKLKPAKVIHERALAAKAAGESAAVETTLASA